jgi:hypothetical protein
MEQGTGWGVAAVASLLLLPLPFLKPRGTGDGRLGLALGVYVLVTILALVAGRFPVPVLGQGASPIIGYLVAIGLLRGFHGSAPQAGAAAGR